MSRADQLIDSYRRQVALPLRPGLALSERVWFLVYPPEDERRVLSRIDEFDIATKEVNLSWFRIDLLGTFAAWMDTFDKDERNQCLTNPEILEDYADPGFSKFVCSYIKHTLDTAHQPVDHSTVVALTGLMDLYDFTH